MALLPQQNPPATGPSDYGQGYGDIYGPVETMQNVQQGGQPQQQPQQPQQSGQQGGQTAQYFNLGSTPGGGNIDYASLGPYTREVQDEELVQNQLQGLLQSDSPYIQQAVRQGERSAARRGALSSSIFAGASQAAAIQAALPIAAQDAQTFSRVYSENAAAINNNTLAEMQSRTSVLQSNIAAHASIASSGIAANTQLQLGEMEIAAAEEAREFNAAHDRAMATLQNQFTRGLAQQEFGFQQRLNEQANEAALNQIGFQGTVNDYLQNNRLRSSFLNNVTGNMFSMMSQASASGIDEQGFQQVVNNGYGFMNSMFSLWNLMNGGGMPEIDMGGGEGGGG